jgi:hypothetical protein
MPAPNLNAGQFTIGPNCSVAIYNGGQEVNVGLITQINFNAKPRIVKKQVNLMSGYTFDLAFLQGWEGSIDIQRTDASLDNFWYQQIESAVQGGLPFPSFNIIATIKETNLSTTRFTFQGAILYYDDSGTYANEEAVMQRISFAAPVRIVS